MSFKIPYFECSLYLYLRHNYPFFSASSCTDFRIRRFDPARLADKKWKRVGSLSVLWAARTSSFWISHQHGCVCIFGRVNWDNRLHQFTLEASQKVQRSHGYSDQFGVESGRPLVNFGFGRLFHSNLGHDNRTVDWSIRYRVNSHLSGLFTKWPIHSNYPCWRARYLPMVKHWCLWSKTFEVLSFVQWKTSFLRR